MPGEKVMHSSSHETKGIKQALLPELFCTFSPLCVSVLIIHILYF